jgi:GrpB-like predicted nucleotidyltransferase (UPF0157 family)
MPKSLSGMTSAELWALFPILLEPHDPAWALRYARERERIERAIGEENTVRISHIGSTAVPGLIAKPTIDILLEIAEGCDLDQLKAALTADGWLFSPQLQNPPPHMMFLKGYTPQGFRGQAFHLHARYFGDWDELYFRDWLISHPEAAPAYGTLKDRLKAQYEHDRDAYTRAKTEFVREQTARAREEFGGGTNPFKRCCFHHRLFTV